MPFGIKIDAMILAPLVYVAIIVGTMATFSSLYRKRQGLAAASMERWFPPNLQRDIYLSLLHLPDSQPNVKLPDTVLRAALMRRAVSVIHRAIDVRNAKGPLQQLLQRGSVSDDTWAQFTSAEQELDRELKEIIEEANSLSPPNLQPPWGAFIFQSAAEMAHNERLREKVEKEFEKSQVVKLEWESRRDRTRKAFLESEGIKDEEVVETPAASVLVKQAPVLVIHEEKKNGSDEEGVLVEAVSAIAGANGSTGSLTPSRPSARSTPSGSMRKKKGKK